MWWKPAIAHDKSILKLFFWYWLRIHIQLQNEWVGKMFFMICWQWPYTLLWNKLTFIHVKRLLVPSCQGPYCTLHNKHFPFRYGFFYKTLLILHNLKLFNWTKEYSMQFLYNCSPGRNFNYKLCKCLLLTPQSSTCR